MDDREEIIKEDKRIEEVINEDEIEVNILKRFDGLDTIKIESIMTAAIGI